MNEYMANAHACGIHCLVMPHTFKNILIDIKLRINFRPAVTPKSSILIMSFAAVASETHTTQAPCYQYCLSGVMATTCIQFGGYMGRLVRS